MNLLKNSPLCRDILLLTLAFSLLFAFMLGHRALSIPDEGRYVEIPREMIETGDFVTPRLNGLKYFEKPVLFYWMEALAVSIAPENETVLRLLPAFLGLLGVLGVYIAGVSLFSRRTGILSAIVLGTSLLYYAHTRIIILDMAVSVFISSALLSFLMATRAQNRKSQRWLLALFFSSCALATLTKGLIGAVLPGGVILFWCLIHRRFEALKLAFTPWGIGLFFLISAPWHILVCLRNPEFFDFYFIHEHFTRFLTTVHRRGQPFWFFVPIVIGGFFPWTGVLVLALRDAWKKRHNQIFSFLMLWAGLILIFFSAGSSKLIPYIVPIFPPLALLCGFWLDQHFDKSPTKALRFGISLTAGLLFIAALIALEDRDLWSENAVLPFALTLLTVLLSLTLAPIFIKRRFSTLMGATVTGAVLFFTTLNGAWPLFERPSAKPFVTILKRDFGNPKNVIMYRYFYHDFSPYMGRVIPLVGNHNELDFGISVEPESPWIWSESKLWDLWKGEQPVFLFFRDHTFERLKKSGRKSFFKVAQFKNNILASNRDPSL
ncbi:MAG: phospholipid carrier-dependent glycosyltransferase [bacterium]|nr:phospholipid carrier-dependent glycosyltransferase [bacterium]